MESILNNPNNAIRILKLTSDTMILLDKNGVCLDVVVYNVNLWFLNERFLKGKNLKDILPFSTYQELMPEFKKVLLTKEPSSHNYELPLKDTTYFFECLMFPFDNDTVICQYRDITARSRKQNELLKHNRELGEIQKAAQINNWEFDTLAQTYKYHEVNEYAPQEAIHEMTWDYFLNTIVPEDKDTYVDWFNQCVKGNLQNEITFRCRTEDDHIVYYRMKSYSREKRKDGSTLLEGYIQNITNVQQSRNDINLLTHAMNNCPEDIYAAKSDGTLIFANRQFRRRHHLKKQDLADGIKIYDLTTYARDKSGWEIFAAKVKTGCMEKGYIVENPIPQRPDILAIDASSFWVTSDEGVDTVWTFGRDVTPRMRRDQEIKRFNTILDNTMENIPAGIVVKDINDGFKYLYRNRESNIGLNNNQEAIGKDDYYYYDPETASRKRHEDIQVATTGKPMHWVEEVRTPNGKIKYIDKRKIKIESRDFTPILLTIDWDITDMELMKRELMQAKEKAEMSDQLKSAFLANMSHEIRTPLNAIVGFSRVIAESENPEERRSYYSIVEKNNERLLNLINEILDLSKIEAGIVEFNITPVRINPICKEVYEAMGMRCPNGVCLVYEQPVCAEDEKLVMDCDKNRLFQVISNLIGNAYKFTTQGKVSYGYRRLENDTIEFHVSDTGTGIEADKVDKVFDRFVKANNFAQGTGLGLSICKTIVEKLGGQISVSSVYGEGTTFTFTLPVYQDDSEEEKKAVAEMESLLDMNDDGDGMYADHTLSDEKNDESTENVHSARKGSNMKTILVAEDTDCNFLLVKAILGKKFRLEHANDGMQAVEMFDDVRPDLILMDMRMPNLGGLDATRIIRELSPKVPIIALTAFAYDRDREMALEAGCTDYMTKPFTQEELMEMVNKYL